MIQRFLQKFGLKLRLHCQLVQHDHVKFISLCALFVFVVCRHALLWSGHLGFSNCVGHSYALTISYFTIFLQQYHFASTSGISQITTNFNWHYSAVCLRYIRLGDGCALLAAASACLCLVSVCSLLLSGVITVLGERSVPDFGGCFLSASFPSEPLKISLNRPSLESNSFQTMPQPAERRRSVHMYIGQWWFHYYTEPIRAITHTK